MLHGSATGCARARKIFCTREQGLAAAQLFRAEGGIDKILPDGRFGVTPGNEHSISAQRADENRRHPVCPGLLGPRTRGNDA